jgi:ATP-binding cassette, subfamily C, bacterial CydD
MTAIPTAPDRRLADWLKAAGEPGRAGFRAAGLAATAGTAAAVVQWTAVAYAVDLILRPGPQAGRLVGAAAAAGAAGVARALALAVSRRQAQHGYDAVVTALRGQALAAVLPDGGPAGPDGSGAAAAHTLIELADQVAAYHRRTQPAGRAAGPSSALVLVVIAVLHWPVAVLLALATPILPVNMRLAGQAAQHASQRKLHEFRRLSQELHDRFRGMRTLVTLGAVEREGQVVSRACDALNRATMAVLRRAFVASAVLEAVITSSIAVCATYVGLVLLGYLHLHGTPRLSLFAGVLVLLLCPVYFAPLREHAAGYHERDEALAAAAALSALLARPARPGPAATLSALMAEPARLGSAAVQSVPASAVAAAGPDGPPAIEIDRLAVRFADAASPVLGDVSATLSAGTFAVLAAPSGQGKTTLLRVLAGQIIPTAGTVRLVDPGTGSAWPPCPGYASWIGQQTVLLEGTLADNIRLGSPGATAEEIERAAGRAGLEEVIARLPRGLHSGLGELGWGISAGEARRVALARALLRDAPLWLLDEPTAHLDARTELDLIEAIRSASAGRTVLIASHSAAVISTADVVWRLDCTRLHERLGALGALAGAS